VPTHRRLRRHLAVPLAGLALASLLAARPAPEDGPGPGPAPVAAACGSYQAPDPHRPVTSLEVRIAPDHAMVLGRQRVLLAPDLPVARVVFRLWANAPRVRARGGGIRVLQATIGGAARADLRPGGNLSTLLSLRLPRQVPAGSRLSVDLSWRLRLPAGSANRMGHVGSTAWFGSGAPLLAWERGVGWAVEPPTSLHGETATSEDGRLADLAVVTDAKDAVLATGTPGLVRPLGAGRVVHHFSAASVRDVMVAAGRFRVVHRLVRGVRLRVGAAPGVPDAPAAVAGRVGAAVVAHATRFGPFPYPDLAVAMLPGMAGGIEFPGAIMLGPLAGHPATLSHEVAHEWFYGLVGNDQARDPWLDEAFATYAEALHRNTGPSYESRTVPAAGVRRVGAPMTYWEAHPSAYYRSVYVQGAVALLRARRAAGPARFDAALRCYVAQQARRVARPADLATALAGLPAARRVLVGYGALPSG